MSVERKRSVRGTVRQVESSLGGDDWQIKDFVGEDWLWRDSHKPGTRDTRGWRRAHVPGSIHDDLWRLGEIANPYVDRNSLLCEWVSQRTWLYKKTFVVDAAATGSRALLRFDGVDYAARFYLNGELIGRHESQFVPACFEVTDRLHYGEENLAAVVLDPAPFEQPQVGYTHAVRTRKTRMNYWWDFCPRLVHLGLWRDVTLELTGPVRIEDICVQTQLPEARSRALVTITAHVSSTTGLDLSMGFAVRHDGRAVAEAQVDRSIGVGNTQVSATLAVPHPMLWWPNGAGEQPLYEAGVAAGDSDARAVTFGIRQVEVTANAGAPASARPYTFTVNGQPVYANGWNWVPLDVLYGAQRPGKLARLLDLAQRAGVNLLRVWGGGLIESQGFYDECDRRGIMVWQEFIQSSSGIDNRPPDDPKMIGEMVSEAEAIVPLLRNHPSLATWCGGNELQRGSEQPCDGSEPMLAALRDVVERLDPGRVWLPTSPSGPVFGNSLENIQKGPGTLHDVHGPWQHQGLEKQFELFNATTCLLNSEFGAEGAANLKTIEAVLPEGARWPATRDNPSWFHSASWWIREPFLEEVLGEYPSNLESLVQVTQYLQASALQVALEANRRRWPQCSGSLPWQFNEPFPNVFGTPSVDYFGEPKPAYYAVKRAYAAVAVTAQFARQAWTGAEAFEAKVFTRGAEDGWSLESTVQGFDGTRWDAEGGDPRRQGPLFFLSLKLAGADGSVRATNRYVFTQAANLSALLELPGTRLAATVEFEGDRWHVTVRNQGQWAALGVWLEDARPRDWQRTAWTHFEDNYVHLLPGEEWTVVADWGRVPEDERGIAISAMNAERVALTRNTEVIGF